MQFAISQIFAAVHSLHSFSPKTVRTVSISRKPRFFVQSGFFTGFLNRAQLQTNITNPPAKNGKESPG
jgi:hypothetical protein